MSQYARVATVTGANKGIGLAIVRQLALQYPQSPFNSGPLLVYLTARDADRGKLALEAINSDSKLREAKALQTYGGLSSVEFLPLDVSSAESISQFAAKIKANHPGGIDILINNAGIALDGFNANIVRSTLDTNYFGPLRLTRALLPQIRNGGRVVNVASRLGRLTSSYADEIQRRFREAKSVEDVSGLMEEYLGAVERGTHEKEWPSSAYSVSKAGMIGMTRTEAALLAQENTGILLNSCCPGYIKTDITKGRGRHTPDEGAMMPVQLALHDIGGVSGEFWLGGEVSHW